MTRIKLVVVLVLTLGCQPKGNSDDRFFELQSTKRSENPGQILAEWHFRVNRPLQATLTHGDTSVDIDLTDAERRSSSSYTLTVRARFERPPEIRKGRYTKTLTLEAESEGSTVRQTATSDAMGPSEIDEQVQLNDLEQAKIQVPTSITLGSTKAGTEASPIVLKVSVL